LRLFGDATMRSTGAASFLQASAIYLNGVDIISLAIGIAALAISIYSAVLSRRAAEAAERSATAAERSARTAEEAVALEHADVREGWVRQLAEALPDGELVESLLHDLPESLRPQWHELVSSACRRNPRTPPARAEELFRSYASRWARTATRK
jgi:hypothetical protein